MQQKLAETQVSIHDLIARRWSSRAFDPDRRVSREQRLVLLEAARWAPSCFGDEPWRYVVCDRFADEAAWHKAFACLGEKNQRWAKHAPILMLAASGSHFTHNGNPNRWGQYDTGAASENLCLQATALGLAVHQMGGFDADKAQKAFAIPEGFTPMAMIAIGYPGDPATLDPEFYDREMVERARKPLQERFFAGTWGVAIE